MVEIKENTKIVVEKKTPVELNQERKEKEILEIVNNKYLSSDEKIKDLEDFGKNFPEIKESVKNAIDSIRDSKKTPAKKAQTPEAVETLLKAKYAVEGRPEQKKR